MSDLQFTIDREAFTNAINWAARTIPGRPLNPILGGIRISGGDVGNLVRLAAFDYEVSAEIELLGADVTAAGTTVVSGRLLAAIGKSLPKKPVEFRTEGAIARLRCGSVECTLPTMDARDFPTLPLMPEDSGAIDSEVLAGALAQTLVAVHRGEGHPMLHGVQLEVTSADTLTLAATDRHRVALRELPWAAVGDAPVGRTLIIPSRAVGELGRMNDGDVYLALDDNANVLGLHGGDRRITTRLIDAKFPDVRKILPTSHTAVATVAVPELAEALNRAILLDEQEFPRVEVAFEDGVVHLTGGKDGIGSIREDIELTYAGEPITMWFNPRYLLDALNATGADKVMVGLSAPRRPILVVPFDGDLAPQELGSPLRASYMHMVMPTTGNVG